MKQIFWNYNRHDMMIIDSESSMLPIGLETELKKFRIVTHSGTFHADEVLGIALAELIVGYQMEVTRKLTLVNDGEFEDPACIVLDIGRVHQPDLMNLDHHQADRYPASCILILDAFASAGVISEYNLKVYELVRTYLLNYVSNVDKGLIKTGDVPCINTIIRNMNNIPDGFNKALEICKSILRTYIETSKKRLESEKRWDNEVVICGTFNNVGLLESNEQILNWREFAQNNNVVFFVCPSTRGGWSIISVDSDKFNIPKDDMQTFRHNTGFMACYANKEEALERASALGELGSTFINELLK